MLLKYCLNLVFSHDYKKVVLMTKNRGPGFLIGKLCGGGGRIEEGEAKTAAASRETVEEFGLHVDASEWQAVALSQGDNWNMAVFSVACDISRARTMEDEIVSVHQVSDILMASVLEPDTIAPDLAVYISIALAKRGRSFEVEMFF
jgi:8-oxo-dGTP pyrophosphatase MutT (NUDIX family)